MSRRMASALLTAALVVSLLAVDRHLAHARHAKDLSVPTGDSSSMKKGLQEIGKLDVGKSKKFEGVEAKARHSFGHGGSVSVDESAKVVVVINHRGPIPHPPKHN